jgi:hypothetical protein
MKETTEVYYDIKCPKCQYTAAKEVETDLVLDYPDVRCKQCGYSFKARTALEVVDLDVGEGTEPGTYPHPPCPKCQGKATVWDRQTLTYSCLNRECREEFVPKGFEPSVEEPEDLPKRFYYMLVECPPSCQKQHLDVEFKRKELLTHWECHVCQKVLTLVRPGYLSDSLGLVVKNSCYFPPCTKCGEKVTTSEDGVSWYCTNTQCKHVFLVGEKPKIDESGENEKWYPFKCECGEVWERKPKAKHEFECACGKEYRGFEVRVAQTDLPGEPTTSIADSVYQGIEDRCGVSYIRLAEDVIERDDVPVKVRMLIAMGLKYLIRVGDKGDWEKDLKKGLNYITRAATGEWAKNADE